MGFLTRCGWRGGRVRSGGSSRGCLGGGLGAAAVDDADEAAARHPHAGLERLVGGRQVGSATEGEDGEGGGGGQGGGSHGGLDRWCGWRSTGGRWDGRQMR